MFDFRLKKYHENKLNDVFSRINKFYEYDENGKYYNTVVVDIPYATCDFVIDEHVAWFASYSKKNKFKLTFEEATAFDYSEK